MECSLLALNYSQLKGGMHNYRLSLSGADQGFSELSFGRCWQHVPLIKLYLTSAFHLRIIYMHWVVMASRVLSHRGAYVYELTPNIFLLSCINEHMQHFKLLSKWVYFTCKGLYSDPNGSMLLEDIEMTKFNGLLKTWVKDLLTVFWLTEVISIVVCHILY